MPEMSQEQRRKLEARAAAVEERTGVQVVAALADKSELYPEIPWKAFALGASAASLPAALWAFGAGAWGPVFPAALAAVLAAGLLAALLGMAAPPVGRLLAGRARLETEVHRHAQSLFLRHQLFSTAGRRGVLILASLYERRLVVLPDTGLAPLLGPGDLRAVVDGALPLLASGRPADALLTALDSLETALLAKGLRGVPGSADEIPGEFLRETGP